MKAIPDRLRRYGFALLVLGLGMVAMRIPIIRGGLGTPVILLFFVVVLSAWYGGLGPGLMTTGLIAFVYSGPLHTPRLVVRLVLFLAGGASISMLAEVLHAARRRAEESRTWLATVLTSIGDAVIATDAHGRVTFTNAVAAALTGWDQAEAVGRPLEEIFSIVNEETRASVENPVARVLRDGHIVGLANHTILIARDGTDRPIDDSGAPIRDGSGAVSGVVLCFRDQTERNRADLERARIAAIVESSEDAILTCDLDGTVRTWNEGASRVFGYTADEMIGMPMSVLEPADSHDETSPILESLQRGVRIDHFETRRVRSDGRIIDVSLSISPIKDAYGRTVGAAKIARDITDRKRAEEELRTARDAAVEANRAKDQFLAVLSHELRTPLTPVLVAVSALLEDSADLPALWPTLEMIQRNIKLESRLIDDLLFISRIERGNLHYEWETVDIHAALRQAVELFHVERLVANIDLELDLSAAEFYSRADEARIMQVFWNLTSNAVRFTGGRGGRLTIRTRNLDDTDPRSIGPRLLIEFRDDGIGIEAELLPRVFEPFVQGTPPARRRHGGLGLGLAISRSIVEAHGGRLSASSFGPGMGTTFLIDLPAVPAPAPTPLEAPPPTRPELVGARGLRILLVEDNKDTLRYLSLVLGQRNHVISTAENLTTARQRASADAIDLLISDIELPDGTGLELMRELKQHRDLPGIALSGFGSEEDIRLSLQAGFAAHLTKPVDVRNLEQTIQQVTMRDPGSR